VEAVLFGKLLDVIATVLTAVTVFHGYNLLVPDAVTVPYPTLAGALTGVASLVPVVGMKVVYAPLTVGTAIPVLMGGNPVLLVFGLAFLVATVVVVDTIPDVVLRPLLSGETTHVALLMLAYTLGPFGGSTACSSRRSSSSSRWRSPTPPSRDCSARVNRRRRTTTASTATSCVLTSSDLVERAQPRVARPRQLPAEPRLVPPERREHALCGPH
jgi:hypothetical protein